LRNVTGPTGLWSARCLVMGTPGAEGGSGKRAGRKIGTASWPDPTLAAMLPMGMLRPAGVREDSRQRKLRGAEYRCAAGGRTASQ
jgi:hypothetical protein